MATKGTKYEPAARVLGGAAGGAGAGVLQNVAQSLYQGIRNLRPDLDDASAKILARAMERDKVTPDQLKARLDELGPGAMLVEAGGPNVRGTVRGAIAAMPEAERALALSDAGADATDGAEPPLPAFAQVWALGFMLAVESWPDEWSAPARDKEATRWMEEALATLAKLCEDDEGEPEISAFETEDGQDGPPSMSAARLEDFGEAVWAVYDLRQIAKSLGPRVAQVRRDSAPGRNDMCPCGSGKKYKKCHGAG